MTRGGHRSNRLRTKAALVSVLAIAVIAPVALADGPNAGLPKPGNPTIVPGVSVGGVSVGQPMPEAEAAWGNRGNCETEKRSRTCRYDSRKRGSAELIAIDDEVVIAAIKAPFKDGEYVFKGPLMGFGTARGDLGLGDKLKRVLKRYPEGKLEGGWSVIFDDGETKMTFFASKGTRDRISQVILASTTLGD